MRPAVMPDYVVVIVLSAIISELLGLNFREEVSQTMCPCSQVMGKSLLFFRLLSFIWNTVDTLYISTKFIHFVRFVNWSIN